MVATGSLVSPIEPARGLGRRSAMTAPTRPCPTPPSVHWISPYIPVPGRGLTVACRGIKTLDSRPLSCSGAYRHSTSHLILAPITTGEEPLATDTPPLSATCSTASLAASNAFALPPSVDRLNRGLNLTPIGCLVGDGVQRRRSNWPFERLS